MTHKDTGAGSGVRQGVASFLQQYYSVADLQDFQKKYALNNSASVTDVPSSQPHSSPGVEASLDIQWLSTMGLDIDVEFWYTAGKQPHAPDNEPFLVWLANVAADKDPPAIFSISYGDAEDGVSRDYAMTCDFEFQKAGLRGITLFAASGDSGVGCAVGSFVPTFPASSPHVTGVGAVQDGTPGQSPTGEIVADLSGGGFSNFFTRPKFQDAAVDAYLKSGAQVPSKSQWNTSGAAFPDVAAQGILFDTCVDDFFILTVEPRQHAPQ